jgi:hypothetical protein
MDRPMQFRLWFLVAAVERLSNAGVFGSGRFTDGSNLDVIPAMLTACLIAILAISTRVKIELVRESDRALQGAVSRLLPAVFAAQIATLFTMETLEQLVIAGHPLGGTIWLGGPLAVSLTAHAFACVVVTYGLAAVVNLCAARAVAGIHELRALVVRSIHGEAPLAWRVSERIVFSRAAPALCHIGNRAPPAAAW